MRVGRPKRKLPIFYILLLAFGIIFFNSRDKDNKSQETPKFLGAEVSSKALEKEGVRDNYSVCIDAGHGGVDQGGNNRKIIEKDIDLIVAQKAKTLLEGEGYQVVMTRTGDESLSKQDRYDYCNNAKADIMVAIHHNSYTDPTVNHASALYYTEFDQKLASSIVSGVSTKLKIKNGGVAKLNSRILSKSNMPATISEAFFMSSYFGYNGVTKSGSTLLADEAQGIVDGIINYFENPDSIKPVIDNEQINPADEE